MNTLVPFHLIFRHFFSMNIIIKSCLMCYRSKKPRQLRCSLTNCSSPSYYSAFAVSFQTSSCEHLSFFFSWEKKRKRNKKKKMGQRKDPTPSVHSLSSGLSMWFHQKSIQSAVVYSAKVCPMQRPYIRLTVIYRKGICPLRHGRGPY